MKSRGIEPETSATERKNMLVTFVFMAQMTSSVPRFHARPFHTVKEKCFESVLILKNRSPCCVYLMTFKKTP